MRVKLIDGNSTYFSKTEKVTYGGSDVFEVPYSEGQKAIAKGILKQLPDVKPEVKPANAGTTNVEPTKVEPAKVTDTKPANAKVEVTKAITDTNTDTATKPEQST